MRHEFIPSDTNEDVCIFNCGYDASDHTEVTGIYDEDEIVGSDYFDTGKYQFTEDWG